MTTMILTIFIFAVIHSLLARGGFKTRARKWMGERNYHGLYRILYNIIATLTLIPVGVVMVMLPGAVIWKTEGILVWVFIFIQIIGLSGLVISLFQIDLGQFTGLSQLNAYLTGRPLPLSTEPLQIRGVYRLVRHPLYLFSLMIIWPTPIMTESLLAFNIASTLYFIIGSRLEENQLVKVFGQPYIEYQRKVPWLIPFISPISPGNKSSQNP